MAKKETEDIICPLEYFLMRYPEYVTISFCVNTKDLYDYILIKYLDTDHKPTRMEQYRLIGNPKMYGDYYAWEDEKEGWRLVERADNPKYHDIRDCYTLVCEFQNEGWKLISGR